MVAIDWPHKSKPFAIGYVDGTLKLGRVDHNSNIITLKAHENSITNLEWDPKGNILATISIDATCKLWEEKRDKLILLHTLIQPYEPTSLKWSPMIGQNTTPLLLAIGTSHGTVCCWTVPDLDESETVPQLMMHNQGHSYNAVTSLAIHNSGLLLASGCPNGILNIWSLHNGSLVYTFVGNGGVNSGGMAWCQNNLTVAFSRCKSLNVLEYSEENLVEKSALTSGRCALMRKGIKGLKTAPFFKILISNLPKLLLQQYNEEKLSVQTGVQLTHSIYLKSLSSLALLLELDKIVCYKMAAFNDKNDKAVVAEWQWLHTFSLGAQIADSLIKRTNLSDEVSLDYLQ